MFVHYYMTPTPLTITSEMSVEEAYNLLRKHSFRHLPVVDEAGVLLGMVTDRDLRSACPSTILKGDELQEVRNRVSQTPVGDIMSRDFVTLEPVSTLDDALLRFKSRSIGAIPVVDSSRQVVGIFSLNDMMAAWRSLMGIDEKGSMLLTIIDTNEANSLSRLVQALERKKIAFTRLIRSPGKGDNSSREPAIIYLRVNTFNLSAVHRIVEEAGFTVQVPDWSGDEEQEKP